LTTASTVITVSNAPSVAMNIKGLSGVDGSQENVGVLHLGISEIYTNHATFGKQTP